VGAGVRSAPIRVLGQFGGTGILPPLRLGTGDIVEPFKIKSVESIPFTTREQRTAALANAGYNLFGVPAELITIDLLTDSGTSAMSDRQWAAIMLGDESYAGSRNYFQFEETVRRITGYRHVIPTHQGRMAENLLFTKLVKPGDHIPNNIHFDTTRANIEHNGGVAVNCVIDEAYDPTLEVDYKGNMDIAKLDRVFAEVGKERMPLVLLTITNNSGGGQPVSLENAEQVSRWCRDHGVPFFFDACRFAENAYFNKVRSDMAPGVAEIARRFFELGDGCTMSAKKDGLVNIGGFVALAIAQGLEDVLDERYLEHRLRQVREFGDGLHDAGIPIVLPVGGHAVYLDARRFLPHIPQDAFPAQALTCELYLEGGIRGVEIGGLMFGADGSWPELELVRLAVPRRVYTKSHLDYVVEVCRRIHEYRDRLSGLRVTYEASALRHFTARLEPLTT
jgi:tryptophanase